MIRCAFKLAYGGGRVNPYSAGKEFICLANSVDPDQRAP